jgi:hypothetical protein
VRAARAREGVWAIGRVQLQVQRLAATRCESLRASQPPERCGPVPQARRRRIYLNVDEAIGRRGRAAPSRALALLEPRLSQPASRPRCRAAVGPLVRDRACAFAAQVMGPSRATPHHLGLLHRVRLKIEVLDLLRASGEDERRAPPWCAPAGIEPPAHMIATALLHSWPALTSLARYGLISAACYDAHVPASVRLV